MKKVIMDISGYSVKIFGVIFILFFAMSPSSSYAANSDILVSIRGVDLQKSESIVGINIRTADIRILAICKIPPGWELTADNPGGIFSGLSGGAGRGVARIKSSDMDELHALFLGRKSDHIPSTISGTIDIEVIGDGSNIVTRIIGPENFLIENIHSCPEVAR